MNLIAGTLLLLSSVNPAVAQSAESAGGRVDAPLEALAASFPAAEGAVRVGLWLGRPLSADEQAPGETATELRAEARLIGASGEVDAFKVEASAQGAFIEDRGRIQVYGDLVAAPGAYQLELSLKFGKAVSKATYPFEISLPSADRPSVQPPFFLDDEGQVAAFFEGGNPSTEPPADYPFQAIGEAFIPDISPRITEDMPRSRVCLMGRGLSDEKTFLESGLIGTDGVQLSKERLAAVGRDEPSDEGYETLCLGVDTQGLEPGTYQLNVVLHDFENRRSDSTELSFELVPQP